MKIAVMQPYFLPYLGYFQLIDAVDVWVNMDHAAFQKGRYMNRNVVAEGLSIRVPLIGASPNKNTRETEIDLHAREWQKQWKSLEQRYQRAPFYPMARRMLEQATSEGHSNLAAFNFSLIAQIAAYLEIPTQLIPSSLGMTSLPREVGLMEILKQFKATQYINSIGGAALYSKEFFASQGEELFFLQPHLRDDLKQVSVFHALCTLDRAEIQAQLKSYSLL